MKILYILRDANSDSQYLNSIRQIAETSTIELTDEALLSNDEIAPLLNAEYEHNSFEYLFSVCFIPKIAKYSYFNCIPYIFLVDSYDSQLFENDWCYNPYNYFFVSDNKLFQALHDKKFLHNYPLPEDFKMAESSLPHKEYIHTQLLTIFDTVKNNPVVEYTDSNIPISICLIGKNEEKHVDNCLKPWFDLGFEIIVADTGSTDKTMELARKYTNNVFYHAWHDHFAEARNASSEWARNPYVLVVDFDEYLTDINLEALIKLCTPEQIGMLSRQSPNPGTMGVQLMIERVARLYHKNVCHYKGRIHEQIYQKENNEAKYYSIPVTLVHQGYADTTITKQKALRNLKLLLLDLDEYGADPYTYFQIGQSYRILKDTDHAIEYYRLGLSMDVDPKYDYVQTMVESYGYCLLDNKDIETALQFENIYDEFSKRADFVFLMGLIYMNAGLFDKAITEFEKATTIQNFETVGTNSFLAWYNAGVICEVCGLTKEALDYYQKCGDYEPAIRQLEQLTIK